MSLRASHKQKRIALALPDEVRHRKQVAAVGDALELLNIAVIWVTRDGKAHFPEGA